jgi:competence protein ComEC
MCWHIKHLIKERAKAKLNQQAYGLFSALFLGKPDNDNPYAYHQSFSWWGLNHYLARAGLHLVILFLILNILITFFTSRFITKTIINLALAIFYCIFTWQNIPFVRAFLVLVGHYTCNILKVPCSILHLLNLVIFFYLLLNPQALFFLDFQLTFAITYTLILIGRLTKIRASL